MSDEKKYYVRSIKFNESEYQKLNEILSSQNIQFSKFTKMKLFADSQEQKEKIKKYIKLDTLSKIENEKYEIVEQLKRIGNNLNQIARDINSNKLNSSSLMTLKKIDEIKRHILEIKPC